MNKKDFLRVLKKLVLGGLYYGEKLPVYLRLPLGIVLCIGGVLGFLPVLGFWMLPLGLLLIGLCIPGIDRRIQRWMHKTQAELARETDDSVPVSNDTESTER